MIMQETLENGLIKTTSDCGEYGIQKYIIQNETGLKYAEALNVPNKYTYTERAENILVERYEKNLTEVNILIKEEPIAKPAIETPDEMEIPTETETKGGALCL